MCIVCAQGLSGIGGWGWNGPHDPAGNQPPFGFTPSDGGAETSAIGDARRGGGPASFTSDQAAAHITRVGLSWSSGLGQGTTITYGFRATAGPNPAADVTGFARFTEAQINVAMLALSMWSEVANVVFQRVGVGTTGEAAFTDNATMLMGNWTSGGDYAGGFGGYPGNRGSVSQSGDLWINGQIAVLTNPSASVGLGTYLHEIGHNLGLAHPGSYAAASGVQITYGTHAEYLEDSAQYSIMSYFRASDTGARLADFSWNGSGYDRLIVSLMMDDIAAIQRLYGANMSTRAGDTVYGFNATADRDWFKAQNAESALWFCAWDGGGIDTFDFSGFRDNQLIDLGQGAFSNVGSDGLPWTNGIGGIGNVSIAVGTVIENAIGGSGNDVILGNEADNVLWGRNGNDRIDGGGGSDTAGFLGLSSAYVVTVSGRTVTVTGAEGADVLTNIERLRFADRTIDLEFTALRVLNGTAGADRITGTAADESIVAGNSADTLIGGGGSDTLDGGAGVDTAVYAGLFRAYALVTQNRVGGGREGGTDTLVGIERLQFLDGTLTFEGRSALWTNDEATMAVARLYQAVLGRAPDLGGLEHYRGAVDQGYDLMHFTRVMIESPEFIARFGSLSNQQFVEQIYRFVLGRDGDAGGIQTYTAALSQGYSRADVVLVFAESPENKVRYLPTWETQVRHLEDGRYAAGAADDPDKDHAAQVLPTADDDALYDPANLGLSSAGDADAFVLPARPEGWDVSLALTDDLDPGRLQTPQAETTTLLEIVWPAIEVAAPGQPAHELDLAWA